MFFLAASTTTEVGCAADCPSEGELLIHLVQVDDDEKRAKARMDATDLIIIVTPLYPVNSKSVFPRDRAPRVWGFDICSFGPK